MTFLSAHLPFPEQQAQHKQHPTSLPPPGSHLIITDTPLSPGYFAIYHLIASAIARKQKVIWVDMRQEGRSSLEAVLRKMSVVLPPQATAFSHIMPSSLPSFIPSQSAGPALFNVNDETTLRPTYDAITSSMTDDSVVILDGLSELLSIGFNPSEVFRFVRAVQAQTKKHRAVLISTLHAHRLGDTHQPEHELLDHLLRLAHGWWRIEGLNSGRSGDVHGEISSFPLVSAGPGWPDVSRARPLQYRLEAGTVKVFPKGTGRGYL